MTRLYRESPTLHSIDPTFIAVLQSWVRDAVAASRGRG